MDQNAMVKDSIDAGTSFLEEFVKSVPVSAAFWLKTAEKDSYLYLATEALEDDKLGPLYGEVSRISSEMRNPNLIRSVSN